MAEWIIEIKGAPVEDLFNMCRHGPFIDDDGTVDASGMNEHEVARLNGLKIEVFSQEHPPPHFRVICGKESNCFTIADCEPMYPNGLKEYWRNIKKWHKKHKDTLIKAWDDHRPTDCPVGKYNQPASAAKKPEEKPKKPEEKPKK